MGFRKMSLKERLAEEPEFSLLGAVFGPSRGLEMRGQGRVEARPSRRRYGSRTVEIPCSSGRRLRICISPDGEEGSSEAESSDAGGEGCDCSCPGPAAPWQPGDAEQCRHLGTAKVCTAIPAHSQASSLPGFGARVREQLVPSPQMARLAVHSPPTHWSSAAEPSKPSHRSPYKASGASQSTDTDAMPAPTTEEKADVIHDSASSSPMLPSPVCPCHAGPVHHQPPPLQVPFPIYQQQQQHPAFVPIQSLYLAPHYAHYPPAYWAHQAMPGSAQVVSNPNLQRTSPPAPTQPEHPPGKISPETFHQNLQALQKDIDHVRMELSRSPKDFELQSKLKILQKKLNALLDTATSRSGQGKAPSQTPCPSQSEKKAAASGNEAGRPRAVPDHKREEHKLPEENTPYSSSKRRAESDQREASPHRDIIHHLCSDCGDVRSKKFHHKHPHLAGQKPLHNVCSPCKEKRIQGGIITEPRHFCYGCGVSRSKLFQRQHAAIMKQPLLPNYCRACAQETRESESLADETVVEFARRSRRTKKTAEDAQPFRKDMHPSGQSNDGPSSETATASSSSDPSADQAPIRGRRRRRRQSEPTPALAKTGRRLLQLHRALKQDNRTASPSGPGRRINPAAQHGPETSPKRRSPVKTDARRTTYRSPYVENVDMPAVERQPRQRDTAHPKTEAFESRVTRGVPSDERRRPGSRSPVPEARTWHAADTPSVRCGTHPVSPPWRRGDGAEARRRRPASPSRKSSFDRRSSLRWIGSARMPEPIIEEPVSGPDSPAPRAKLLEFRAHVTDSSTDDSETQAACSTRAQCRRA